MVAIQDFLDVSLYTVKRININERINFKSFKKDRQIEILKLEDNLFEIFQNGFEKKVFKNLDLKELQRTLKYLQKKEFPKSNKLWYKIIKNK